MSEAIPHISFLSKLRNHPSEPRESGEFRTVNGPKYADEMGSLGIRAAAEKSCPDEPGRSPFYEKVYLIVTIICGYYILRIFAILKKSQN